MKFSSLQPFVPSGKDFQGSKELFKALGFQAANEDGDYVAFEKDGCRFILQNFDNEAFAQNFMLTVGVSSAAEFWQNVIDQKLPEKFGIRISAPTRQPYGIEVNLIDIAGVCWHFVE